MAISMTSTFISSLQSFALPSNRRSASCCAAPATTPTRSALKWGVAIPPSCDHQILHHSPPLLRLPAFLSHSECEALIDVQLAAVPEERENYLKFDSGVGHGFRTGVDPCGSTLAPVLQMLCDLFPGRTARFAEELWVRPSMDEIIVREVTTVRYFAGEGVARHVDGKDATLLVYLMAPKSGGATVFPDVGLRCDAKVGDALLYESKRELLHFAENVEQGEKWVLQLLIDFRVRSDDLPKKAE